MPCPIRELSDGESLPSVLASMSGRQALRDVGVRREPFRLISCTRERVRVFHFADGTRDYFVGAATQDDGHGRTRARARPAAEARPRRRRAGDGVRVRRRAGPACWNPDPRDRRVRPRVTS